MTRYEIAIRDNGKPIYLVGYSPRVSRHGLLAAMQNVGQSIIDRLGITDNDQATFTARPRPFCQMGGWWIGFTGRTQKEAEQAGELPFVARRMTALDYPEIYNSGVS